jgi:hypothetical protein
MMQPRNRKILASIAGGLAGALIFPLIAVMVFMAVDRTPAYGWDLAGFFLLVPIVLLSAVVGGLAGAWGVSQIAEGDWSGAPVLAWAAILVAAIPLAVYVSVYVVLPLIPGRTAPASRAERNEWVARIGKPDPAAGLQLADQVRSCVDTMGLYFGAMGLASAECQSLAETRGDVADRTRYLSGDLGWRWMFLPEPPRKRVVIYPDELLKASSPVFEVWESGVLMKRERRDAPAFVVSSDLPAVQAYRACLLAAASAARDDGTWNGDWVNLLDAVGRHLSCPPLSVQVADQNSAGMQNVRLLLPSGQGAVDLSYRPVRSSEGGFDMLVPSTRRRYLLDRDGQWHVTHRMQFASESDPPPLSCEIDPSVTCDGTS